MPGEARAGAGTVNPVQTSTYNLGTHNPTTFGAETSINAVSPSYAGVYGSAAAPWTVANYGVIQGPLVGINLASSGSTATNWGRIGGTGPTGVGIVLPNGGTVTNQSSGSISGYIGVAIEGSAGAVTNAGSITGHGTVVFVASGSVNNQSTGTINMISGLSALTVYVGHGGSVTNAGTITNSGYNTAAIATGGGGTVTNSGRITATGVLDTGVYTLNGGTATNSGIIVVTAAEDAGVLFLDGGALNNSGTVTASGNNSVGVYTLNGGTVTNSGTITGMATGGMGVALESGGTVYNQSRGKISGANAGVLVVKGTGSVTNAGGIYASMASANAVTLLGGGTVNNTKTISGAGNGVVIEGGSVTNTGTITGGHFGLYIGGGGAVTNSGKIAGGTASVVFGGSGTNTLTLQTGSTLFGAASGSTVSGATDGLILQGHGTASNNFANFETLNAEGSGAWTLSGNSSFGDAMVSSGTLSVTGVLTSQTLEIAGSAQFDDDGAVAVTGAVTNGGNLTINGVTMHVVGAGGTFTQLAGGTTTLQNGGVLDPSTIVIQNGVFGGSGSITGDVSVTGGAVKPGAGPGGSLTFLGAYSQTGGEIVFDIDPNGAGGFLETNLIFDPNLAIGLSDTTLVFDFLNGANARQFIAGDLLNLDTFLGLTGGGAFCAELNCGTVLQDISFADNVGGLTITGFDPTTGAVSSQAAVAEPGSSALIMTGMFGLAGLGLRRRMRGRLDDTDALIPPSVHLLA